MSKRTLAIGHGLYFAATGVWPLVDMKSFEAVTRPKTDKWLERHLAYSWRQSGRRSSALAFAGSSTARSALALAWSASFSRATMTEPAIAGVDLNGVLDSAGGASPIG